MTCPLVQRRLNESKFWWKSRLAEILTCELKDEVKCRQYTQSMIDLEYTAITSQSREYDLLIANRLGYLSGLQRGFFKQQIGPP